MGTGDKSSSGETVSRGAYSGMHPSKTACLLRLES
jgi:hypothetical protein